MNRVHFTSFSDIDVFTLYKILKLRQDVFIIEQNCVYNDIDNLDQKSEHLLLMDGEKLAGYSRIVPAGEKYKEVSLGRIIVQKKYRGQKTGRELIAESLQILKNRGENSVRIEAQLPLLNYYEEFGFLAEGDSYLLDGIPHIEMIKYF
ncbi:MAG: GNAT family N-acetyltransferase [Balneolaceae bacterium]